MAHSLAHNETLSSAAAADDWPGRKPTDAEFREHLSTYRGFVRGMMLFACAGDPHPPLLLLGVRALEYRIHKRQQPKTN